MTTLPNTAHPSPPTYPRDERGRILLSSFLEAQHPVYFDGNSTWSLHCQAHGDSHPSLDITAVRDADTDVRKVLMNCWSAACEKEDVLRAYGLSRRDIATMVVDRDAWDIDNEGDAPRKRGRGGPKVTSAYKPITGLDQANVISRLEFHARTLHGTLGVDGILPSEAREYIARRWGLTPSDVHKLGLGFAPIERFKNDNVPTAGISVPFKGVEKDATGSFRLGDVMGYQVRNVRDGKIRWDGPANPSDGRHGWTRTAWFNIPADAPGNDAPIIITEGPGDALTAVSLGAAAVAVRGSKNAQNEDVRAEVVAMVQLLSEARGIAPTALIAKDGDQAGEGFIVPLANALVAAKIPVTVMNTPAGEDLTSLREANRLMTLEDLLLMSEEYTDEVSEDLPETTSPGAAPAGGGLSAFGELSLDVHDYKNTDLNSAYLVQAALKQLGGHARYNSDTANWMTYDATTGLWKVDTLNRLEAALRRLASYLDDTARRDANEVARFDEGTPQHRKAEARAKHSSNMSFRFETATKIDATIKMLKSILIVANADFDHVQNRDLIVVGNGVVNAETLELSPHNPELMATRGTQVHWNPAAHSAEWDAFVTQISVAAPDAMPDYLQELFGTILIGRVKDHFWHLYGKGGAGKGTLVRNIGAATGNYITELKGADLEAGFATGRPSPELLDTMGARGILIDEVPERCLIDDAMLKAMTGQGLMMARPMYGKDIIRFRLQGSMLCIANNYLRYKTVAYGTDLTRRIVVVPFKMQLNSSQRQSNLDDQLTTKDGLEAILAWTILGAQRSYTRSTWDQDPFVREATDAMWAELNPLSDVLGTPGSPLELSGDHEKDRVFRPDTYTLYSQWMSSRGVENRMSSTAFYKYLENAGAKTLKSNGKVYLTGIRITPAGLKFPAAQPPED